MWQENREKLDDQVKGQEAGDFSLEVGRANLSECGEVDVENAVCRRREEMSLLRDHVTSKRQREMGEY